MLAALTRAFRRASTLRADERRFAALAWFLAPAVEATLALAGAPRMLRWIDGLPLDSRIAESNGGRVTANEGERLVNAVYKLQIVRGSCLPRALLQYLVHRIDGASVRFVIGVRRPASGLEAHAWVEEIAQRREIPYAPIFGG